ncbi:MAG: type VI secretion system baseplate subunit TssF, partial [Planctomycetota bacterium]
VPVEGEQCQFRSAFELQLLPASTTQIRLLDPRYLPASGKHLGDVASMLIIDISTSSPQLTFGQLLPGDLTFYCDGLGHASSANSLYESLLNDCVDCWVDAGIEGEEPVRLGPRALEPLGYSDDESMLPSDPRVLSGHRLLTEHFAYPFKFRFVRVRLEAAAEFLKSSGRLIRVLVALRRERDELRGVLTPKSLRLNCIPLVNLFGPKTAEPINANESHYEFRIVPDRHHDRGREVYDVVSLTGIDSTSKKHVLQSIFGGRRRDAQVLWAVRRAPSVPRSQDDKEAGTDVFVSLLNANAEPAGPQDLVLHPEVLCLNRDLPSKLARGEGRPQLRTTGLGIANDATLLFAPTRTCRPPLGSSAVWRLLSFVNLNSVALDGGRDASGEPLREMLALFNVGETQLVRDQIESITGVRASPISRRIERVHPVTGQIESGLARGLEIALTINPEKCPDQGAFLLGSVLDRLFAHYVSINSFTETVVLLHEQDRVLRRWRPRAGGRALL